MWNWNSSSHHKSFENAYQKPSHHLGSQAASYSYCQVPWSKTSSNLRVTSWTCLHSIGRAGSDTDRAPESGELESWWLWAAGALRTLKEDKHCEEVTVVLAVQCCVQSRSPCCMLHLQWEPSWPKSEVGTGPDSEPQVLLASLPEHVYSGSLNNTEAVWKEEKCSFTRGKISPWKMNLSPTW